MSSVMRSWVAQAPWKCQSILLSGLRGPDVPNCPNVKKVVRWMRSVSQNNADPTSDYMQQSALPSKEEVEAELEYLSCHFVHHFADALRVIGLWLPDLDTRRYANELHCFIAEEIFHFQPESVADFINRHQDRVPA